MTESIAFLGIGLMGRPMAANLIRAGHDMTIWNRSPEKTAPLAELGSKVAKSASEAISEATIVIVMLESGPIVEKVLFDSGAAEAIRAGALVVDMSSIKPAEAKDHARRLGQIGVAHLDAPVSGGVPGAEAATLAIITGGPEDSFARAAPVLRPMGRPVHVGPSGAGQLAKLANQIIVGATIGAVAEALMLAERGGADGRRVIQALRGGFADSKVLDVHGPRIVARDFKTHGRSVTHLKDIDNALSAAQMLGLSDLPYTSITGDLFRELFDSSGDLDHAALSIALQNRNPVADAENRE